MHSARSAARATGFSNFTHPFVALWQSVASMTSVSAKWSRTLGRLTSRFPNHKRALIAINHARTGFSAQHTAGSRYSSSKRQCLWERLFEPTVHERQRVLASKSECAAKGADFDVAKRRFVPRADVFPGCKSTTNRICPIPQFVRLCLLVWVLSRREIV